MKKLLYLTLVFVFALALPLEGLAGSFIITKPVPGTWTNKTKIQVEGIYDDTTDKNFEVEAYYLNDTTYEFVYNSVPGTVQINYDGTPPSVEWIQPSNGETTNGMPLIKAKVSDSRSGVNPNAVEIYLDGVLKSGIYTPWTQEIVYLPGTVLGQGVHTIKVKVTDKAGNTAEAESTFTVSQAKFNDTEAHWAKENIAFLANQKLINGYPGGIFAPENKITRAELATILVRALGFPLSNNNYFRDVSPGHWAYSYISTAKDSGLISGYPDGTFKPEQNATRAEIATMLVRAFKLRLKDNSLEFKDIGGHWASEAVNTMASNGLTTGYYEKGNRLFKPDNPATRAEVATFIKRCIAKPTFFTGEAGETIDLNIDPYFQLPIIYPVSRSHSDEMILSSSPEYMRDSGRLILYRDKLPGDGKPHRVYYYHVNSTSTPKRIYVMVYNSHATDSIGVLIKKKGKSGGSTDPFRVGRDALYNYLSSTNVNEGIRIGPQQFGVVDISDVLGTDAVANGIYDLEVVPSGFNNAEVFVVAADEGDNLAGFLPDAPIGADGSLRGTFIANINLQFPDVDGSGQGFALAREDYESTLPNSYEEGQNLGNFGIKYTAKFRINSPVDRRVAVILNPRGGGFAGAVRISTNNSDFVTVFAPRDNNNVGDKLEGIILAKYDAKASQPIDVTLEFIPPGGSYLPVHVAIIPY